MKIYFWNALLIFGCLVGIYSCYNAKAEIPRIFGSFDRIDTEMKIDTHQVQTIPFAKAAEPALLLSDFIDSSWTIPLETNAESIIGKIDKVEIHQQIIYIMDSYKAKNLLAFDLQGNFKFQIGEQGIAAGKYMIPHDFCINKAKGEIAVYDDVQNKILFYDLVGNFKKELAIKFLLNGIASFESDGYILNCFGRSNPLTGDTSYRLVHLNAEHQIISKGIPYPKVHEKMAFRTNRIEFSANSNELLYCPNFLGEIYSVHEQGVQLKYKFGKGKKGLPENYWKLTTAEFVNSFQANGTNQHVFFSGPIIESQNHLTLYLMDSQKFYTGIYDKTTETMKYGRLTCDLPDSFNSLLIHTLYEGAYLVGSQDSYLLTENKKQLRNSKSPGAQKILDGLQPTDNPILNFYHLKNNSI